MQGTVWGSLMCTSTMDKLGKTAYENPDILYKYNGVPIPPLGMVDDVESVSGVENTAKINKLINTFIEHKKLKLSESKCSRIHIGNNHEDCPELKVHESSMKESDNEKYLGDVISKDGKNQATIDNRKAKAIGAIAEIMSIIEEIPFGKHKFEVAMKLRESMFLNRILCNSEAWHAVTAANIVALEKLDQEFLRSILKAHSKTTKEMLYLETGAIPIRWILPQRRINYLKHIVSRKKEELILKVFEAQKENKTKGDFVTLVEHDLRMFGLTHEEVAAESMTKKALKKELKQKAQRLAFADLMQQLQKGSKGKDTKYNNLEIQEYLISAKLNDEDKHVMTALRTKCVKGIRRNFPGIHRVCQHCPQNCMPQEPQEDTQEHVLSCRSIGAQSTVPIEFLGAGTVEQSLFAKEFSKRMRRREELLEDRLDSSCSCSGLPGVIPDQRAL